MYKIRVDTLSNAKRAVHIYTIKLLNDAHQLTHCIADVRIKCSTDLDKIHIDYLQKEIFVTIPCGITSVTHQNHDIFVERIETDPPVPTDGLPTRHSETYISCDDSLDAILDFIRCAIDFYKDIYLDAKDKKHRKYNKYTDILV